VAALADVILNAFKEPFAIDHFRLTFSVSIGYVIADGTSVDPTQVLRDANIAMQKAKDRGRGLSQEFDAELLQQKLDTAALEADLKLALPRQEFSVVYQPIITLNSVAASGFEVLIRWRHPQRGMVPPDKFIPMAEASGLIFEIGLWVLEQACQQLRSWREMFGPDPLPIIAVNLSPVQLEREDFLDRMDDIFQRTGVSPTNIEFEITESALLRHTDTVDETLDALRQRGIRLAIDDFGTGYSSLSYLDKLPVQVLKIDRSFVNALIENEQTNNNTSEIVRATIALAHNLGMTVVAEGIETAQQLALLQSYGCDFGQGYFFARPMPPVDATALMEKNRQQ
jgi:EAL domain-containing protein (putative c-di-GMP-specific phosphodiesterase class I)